MGGGGGFSSFYPFLSFLFYIPFFLSCFLVLDFQDRSSSISRHVHMSHTSLSLSPLYFLMLITSLSLSNSLLPVSLPLSLSAHIMIPSLLLLSLSNSFPLFLSVSVPLIPPNSLYIYSYNLSFSLEPRLFNSDTNTHINIQTLTQKNT